MTDQTPQTGDEQQSETPIEAAAGPNSDTLQIPDALPVLPLRGGTVVFPLAVVPLNVGQPRSVQLVDDAMRGNRMVALVRNGAMRHRRTAWTTCTRSARPPSSTNCCGHRMAPCG